MSGSSYINTKRRAKTTTLIFVQGRLLTLRAHKGGNEYPAGYGECVLHEPYSKTNGLRLDMKTHSAVSASNN